MPSNLEKQLDSTMLPRTGYKSDISHETEGRSEGIGQNRPFLLYTSSVQIEPNVLKFRGPQRLYHALA